jgi:PAS domain-containing protein
MSLLQATLEATADGILVVNRAGQIVTFNQQFVATWGLPHSLVETRDDHQVFACALEQLKDPAGFLQRIKELYAQPDAESADVLELKDGRVLERYSRPQYLDGNVVGRVWSFRDVTLQRQAADEVRRSQLFLSRSQEAAHIGSWEWDIVADRVTWTDELYRLYGLAPQSVAVTYEKFLELCHTDDRDRVRATVDKAYEDHQPYEIKYRIVRPDGQTRTLHGRGAVTVGDAGGPIRMLGTGQDITPTGTLGVYRYSAVAPATKHNYGARAFRGSLRL